MTFALIATHTHLLRLPRVLQVSQASDFLKERLLRQCHVRTLPTVEISRSSHRQTEQPINDVTIVDCSESACAALKALVKLSDEGRHIAWNVHQHDAVSDATVSDKDRGRKEIVLSAFAGDDVNFGNGPHLFVRTRDERYVDQFKRYFELNDSQCVWHDMSSSFNMLSSIGIRPNGFHRDVQTMAYITALINNDKKLKFTKTSTPIDLQSLASSVLCSSSSSKSPSGPPSSKRQDNLEWVQQVCDETLLLHSVHDQLCQVMEDTPLSNLSTPLEHQADITCVLDAYDNFFRLVQQSLYDIETTGVNVDPAALKKLEKELREQNTSLEKVFLEWASNHCEDAKHMSASNAKQLRQLLFAPCYNSVNVKQSLARTGKFTVSMRESDLESQEKEEMIEAEPNTSEMKKKAKKRKKASTVKKEIEITGIGLAPQMYLKNGWPSTSTVALRKLVGHPSIVEDEDEEKYIKTALNHLIQASEFKTKANKISKIASSLSGVHGRLPLRHYCGTEGIGVFQSIDMPTREGYAKIDVKYGPDFRRAITPSDGNKFVIVRYHRLRLWALAQLSQCSVLRERVEHRHDMATTGALRLYKGLSSELQAANPDNAPISNELLKAHFPETYNLARRVDSAFKVGGGVGGTARISVVTGQRGTKAKELRARWYGAHPMVEQWHQNWRDDALTNGVVSSMMGRPHPVMLPQNASRIKVETALTSAMQFVLAASAAEGVMAGVTRMTMNEQLRALGWSVVLADDDTVVLEGPDYSVDSALPLITQNTSRPFALKSWVTMNVAPVIASSLQTVEIGPES